MAVNPALNSFIGTIKGESIQDSCSLTPVRLQECVGVTTVFLRVFVVVQWIFPRDESYLFVFGEAAGCGRGFIYTCHMIAGSEYLT